MTTVTWLIIAVSILGFLLLVLVLGALLLFRGYSYQPLKKRKELIRLFSDAIFLKDGYKLFAHYHFVPNDKPLLVFIQGINAHLHELEWLQAFCLRENYSYFFYSHRYSGVNPQVKESDYYNFSENLRDCKEILLFLAERHPEKKIVALGQGLGAAMLAKVAEDSTLQRKKIKFGLINLATKKEAIDQQYLHFAGSPSQLLNLAKDKILKVTNFFSSDFYPLFVTCKQGCTNKRYLLFVDFAKKNKANPTLVLKYMAKHKFDFIQWPIYYFLFWNSLFGDSLHGIKNNTKNKIIFFQGKKDHMWDDSVLRDHFANHQEQKNIKLIYLEGMENNFSLEDWETNQVLFKDKILAQFE